MFLVNSRPGLVTATPFCEGAPLLPKLRGYFAEFLRESYLAPLGILYLPTCVGFGYGRFGLDSDFSWQLGIGNFSTYVFDTYRLLEFVKSGFAYFSSYGFRPSFPSDGFAYPFASSLLS